MTMHALTPYIESVERYLLRVVPNLEADWEGATEEEIASIQALTTHPLPPFYLWFLRRMGHSMGQMAYPMADFSVQAILAAYADTEDYPIEADWIKQRYLLIGYNRDEVMPLHRWYDLERRTPEDALVVHGQVNGGMTPTFATFGEMLVWGESGTFRVYSRPQACNGSFTDEAYEPFVVLDPMMEKLGFHQPVIMGDRCRVYEREDVNLPRLA
jgi:hypothetical protein